MKEAFVRTAMVFGEEAIETLQSSRVAVFGLGGVGGYVVEALARSGVGALDLIDHDTVSVSNLNRQIIAHTGTVGQLKTEAAKDRVKLINPDCVVGTYPVFYLPETADGFDFSAYDYVVDAVDTVTAKLALIFRCKEENVPVISCMGTGNKTDPSRLEVADISKTSVCPLARVMRRELKKRGILHVKTVFSKEEPIEPNTPENTRFSAENEVRRSIPGSTAFVPASAGLLIASEVVKDLIEAKKEPNLQKDEKES